MRKLILLCMACMLLCFSCNFFAPEEYYCEPSEVESIQIVQLDQYVQGEYRFEYTVLSQISDHETFVNRLNQMERAVNWGDPTQMYEQYIVIRIDYKNGDFDLIHPDAQCFHRSGVNNYGYFFFDDDEFDALISEYITE